MLARVATDEELLNALAGLYGEVDALHAGFSCPASTECCRFGLTGREPYVTSIELLAIERALARRGGGLPSTRKRALPLHGATPEDERTCPLLDRAGRCSVYEVRPFGCRTFYCARAERGADPRRALRPLLAQLRELAARHRPGRDAARALTSALGAKARARG
jgi:Fe-S-cluster containining protein